MSEFSVLLPVYAGDQIDHFARSVRSVAADQVLRPSQIVIVRDGPVPDVLEAFLGRLENGAAEDLAAGVPIEVVRLPENVGLARALNAGLERCSHDIVARADADDISLPQRFSTQIPLFDDGYVLVGSAVAEFSDDERSRGVVRTMPETTDEIREVVTLRSPFNHPTVVYRASAVREAGGYEDLDRMEDYWLWARMVAAGGRMCNVPEVLVLYRVGAGAYGRRGGLTLLRSEVELQRRMHRMGLTAGGEYARNLVVRGAYRLVPTWLRIGLYRGVGSLLWFRQPRTDKAEHR